MGKGGYLAMKTDPSGDLLSSDLNELGQSFQKLANHALHMGLGLGLGGTLFQWIASAAAIYLLVLDRTNWKTNVLTTLLVPYIFMSLPSIIFNTLRGDVGKWIAFIAVVLRLFFPKHFPDWLEMPASLILLVVAAPGLFANTIRGSWIGLGICLGIACYLLQEHIRASGGFRNSFTQSKGISNSIGIILILVFPVWALVFYLL
uniref:Cold-regulated COR413pm n=1 Tax=Phlox subulata TaxID=103544 RepID=A0A1B2BI24_9ERIC|nr:cold-regulated COR413pm [Phlox subulata]